MLAEPYGKLIVYILACMAVSNYLCVHLLSYTNLRLCFTVLMGLLPLTPFIFHSLRSLLSIASAQYGSFCVGKPRSLFDEHIFQDIVLPSDIDFNFHMNNSRYQLQLDFVRIRFFIETGLMKIINAHGASSLMVAISSRYRRSLNLFQRYKIKTKIVSWDEESVYLEHRFVAPHGDIPEFTYFISMCKMRVLRAAPADILRVYLQTETLPAPPQSDELDLFKRFNATSSATLRSECS